MTFQQNITPATGKPVQSRETSTGAGIRAQRSQRLKTALNTNEMG